MKIFTIFVGKAMYNDLLFLRTHNSWQPSLYERASFCEDIVHLWRLGVPFRRLPAWWELLEVLRYLTCTLARISSCFYNPCAGKAEKVRFCLRWRHREPEAMLDDWARRGPGLLVGEEPPLQNRKIVFQYLDYFEKKSFLSKIINEIYALLC